MVSFKKQLTVSQLYGSGLALILIFLLLYLFGDNPLFLHISVVLIILLMVWPAPFKYFGLFWFAFGETLGFVVSRIILSLIFILIVIPVGLLKRKSIRNNMNLNDFAKSTDSVFKERNHTFLPNDLIKPF
jgi:uncharacterized membrane protein YgaE (UPF0421/DUF939 family)